VVTWSLSKEREREEGTDLTTRCAVTNESVAAAFCLFPQLQDVCVFYEPQVMLMSILVVTVICQ
jgi:hypothetical protein